MRATAALQQSLEPSLCEIHKKRIAVVWDVVEALLRGHRLMPTRLGRALAGESTVKSRIKRVDRLLGNWRFQAEVPQRGYLTKGTQSDLGNLAKLLRSEGLPSVLSPQNEG